MSTSQPRRILLLGNPNTGKTTVFNYLTGFRASVGNYAGVTVEHKSGPLKGTNGAVEVIDLPGTYSLAARSADELVAVQVLLGQRSDAARPDAVLIIVDASNLERNLFLATQVMECGLPCAVVFNMMDLVKKAGITLKTEVLSERLGVRVFPIAAAKYEGFEPLLAWMQAAALPAPPPSICEFPATFRVAADNLRAALIAAGAPPAVVQPMLIQRVLLDEGDVARSAILPHAGSQGASIIDAARKSLAEAEPRFLSLEARTRYGAIRKLLEGLVQQPAEPPPSWSDALDRVLIHRVWGLVIFAFLMLIVFQAIYSWSAPFMDIIDAGFGALGGIVEGALPEGPFRSFLVGGVISGVGGVIVFLPQILVLFFFISILEDCGYIARAAFLMDRLLSRVGLSGRSFIPMLSSFACAIPGIMATRTIENPKDRLTTILVAPLMSCSARLPVYTLLIGTFVPDRRLLLGLIGLQGLTLFAMYLVGIFVAIPVALLLKRTLLKGATPTFLMELPPYRWPIWRMVFHRLVDRGGAFLKRAGTIIFAVSVVIWGMTYYPRPDAVAKQIESTYAPQIAGLEAALAEYTVKQGSFSRDQLLGIPAEVLANDTNAISAETRSAASTARAIAELESDQARETDGAYLRQSILGRLGVLIEPAVRPLGWDWKIGMAAIASFPAREVVVSTLGIIYDLGGDTGEGSDDLRSKLRNAEHADGRKVFNLAVAFSIMVFFALCAQCAATLAVIHRETNSWKWPAFAFAYMTGLAYLGALVTYQVAILFLPGGGS